MLMQRQLRLLVGTATLLALPACYTYVPVATMPTVGEQMALEISDKGRVELADRFGPGLYKIQGRLVADSAEQYVMNVFGVTQVDGSSSTWSGERIRIPHEYVAHFEGRQISVGRTVVAAVAGTAAVVTFIATHTAGASGSAGGSTGGTGSTPASIIHPSIH